MIKKAVTIKIGDLALVAEKSVVMSELMVEFKHFAEDE